MNVVSRLQDLAALRDNGAISDDEFDAAKKRVLATPDDIRHPEAVGGQDEAGDQPREFADGMPHPLVAPLEGTAKRPWKLWLAVAGVAALILLVWGASGGNSTSVEGTFLLSNDDDSMYLAERATGQRCSGSGGYDDIRAGAQVRVVDQNGALIGTGALSSGVVTRTDSWAGGDCEFTFAVSDLPEADFYSFEVSHRGAITYSADELRDQGYSVDISLGE